MRTYYCSRIIDYHSSCLNYSKYSIYKYEFTCGKHNKLSQDYYQCVGIWNAVFQKYKYYTNLWNKIEVKEKVYGENSNKREIIWWRHCWNTTIIIIIITNNTCIPEVVTYISLETLVIIAGWLITSSSLPNDGIWMDFNLEKLISLGKDVIDTIIVIFFLYEHS